MKFAFIVVVSFLILTSCSAQKQSLAETRKAFHTHLTRETKGNDEPEIPPAESGLKLVTYPGPLGPMAAYVGRIPTDDKLHPAIIWIAGGFSNSIDANAWTPGPAENDQSASKFRDAGIIMMYPSLRGGNKSPGRIETFLGELDDVLAAASFLAQQKGVDPKRVYLGGHSTGGTVALLVAEMPNPFRAIFSLGPVDNVAGYGEDVLPFDVLNQAEIRVRSPSYWLNDIQTHTFVFEGASGRCNIRSVLHLADVNKNPRVHFTAVPGRNHFSLIFPLVHELAKQILADTGADCTIDVRPASVAASAK